MFQGWPLNVVRLCWGMGEHNILLYTDIGKQIEGDSTYLITGFLSGKVVARSRLLIVFGWRGGGDWSRKIPLGSMPNIDRIIISIRYVEQRAVAKSWKDRHTQV